MDATLVKNAPFHEKTRFLIRLEDIHKTFVVQGRELEALGSVSLQVPKGSVAALIGPSGAGKSTLLRCVNLLSRPSRGRVFVAERELTGLGSLALATARRKIGMVFQQPNLMASRTVFQNVALPLTLAGQRRADIQAHITELLDLVGLSDKRDAYPAQLSGGQQQRATIARALATRPEVMLCDEATSALDPTTTRSVVALLREVNRRFGITILIVSHEMEVVKRLCDEVHVLEAGRIVEHGPVARVFARPESTVAREFLDHVLGAALPEEYRARLRQEAGPGSVPLVRLTLDGGSLELPVVSRLARDFGVDLLVVSSFTDYAAGTGFRRLFVEQRGSDEDWRRAREWLERAGVDLEVVAHVVPDDRTVA